jgi:hypothetical protein
LKNFAPRGVEYLYEFIATSLNRPGHILPAVKLYKDLYPGGNIVTNLQPAVSGRGLADGDLLGVDGVDIEVHRDELPSFVGLLFVGLTDRTPELNLLGPVELTLAVDPEADELLALVLDDGPLPDPGITADDELLHVPQFTHRLLNDFGAGRAASAPFE